MLRTRCAALMLIAVALVTNGCSATRPASPLKCATVGALAGGLAGGVAGAAWDSDSGSDEALMGMGVGIAAGALLGAGICAMLPEKEIAQTAAPPPPPPPAPVPEPEPEPEVKRVILLPGVSFSLNAALLSPEAKTVIDRLVIRVMNEDPDMKIRVEGYTDTSGEEDYNQNLSERRALAVKSYITESGIAESRVESIGYGEMRPVASNATIEGRRLNRRVEIKVLEF